VKYLPNGVRVLARGTVFPGSTFAILGEHYVFGGKTYFGLKAAVGLRGRAPTAGGENAGTSLKAGEDKPLVMIMQTGCVGTRSYVLAAGVVRTPHSVVLARVGHRTMRLRQTAIPRSFEAGDSLVYGVLPAMPSDVTVRNRAGRVLVDEQYEERGGEHCQNGEAGAGVVGSVG
jgi:hypothetical protein